MKRWLYLSYGLAMYLMFLAVYAYFAGFVGNFLVPRSIDAPVTSTAAVAVAINLLLVGMFAIQHSVMARPAFKRWWTRIIPQPIERSTYLLAANLATIFLIWQWRPIDAMVWNVQQPVVRAALWVLFAAGWLSVPAVSLLINHFDLFGLRQVWLHFHARPYTALPFRTPLAYAHVRHPLYLGWALAFWATPSMTVGHLLFAGSLTVYMALAAVIEESDLIAHFGHHYHQYRQHVPMFVPRLRPVRTLDGYSAEFEVNLSSSQVRTSEVQRVDS
jgi:protein-S-isoprenylcysteine O-methyltransferase Ste14